VPARFIGGKPGVDAREVIESIFGHLCMLTPRSRGVGRQASSGNPDLLVAAAAEEHDLTVVHCDNYFDLIASVTGQRCRWIVPAGSAD